MKQEKDLFEHLLKRYVAGDCSPEEEKVVEDWYERLGAGRLPQDFNPREKTALRKKMWKIISNKSRGFHTWGGPNLTAMKGRWYMAASAAVLLVLAAVFVKWQTGPSVQDEGALSGPLIFEKVNNGRNTMLVVLQDESMVWLKPSGSIRYTDFSRNPKREIHLKGEAYFEVSSNPAKPFLVYSGNVRTRVTGTKFYVKANDNAERVEVEVTEGSVEVSRTKAKAGIREERSPELRLAARQKAVYHTGSRKMEKLSMIGSALQPIEKLSETISFEFSDTPLRKVIGLLEKVYPVHIELENPALEECPLTASLNDETLDIKLELICRSLGASFSKGTDGIRISGGSCF